MNLGWNRRGGFTLVETLFAALLGLSAVALLGALGPVADAASVAAQRRVAVRTAENVRAAWPGGRAPVARGVRPDEWLALAPDDARLWWADAGGWGAWAEETAPSSSRPGPPIAFEIALVAGESRPQGVSVIPASAWLVVSWPVWEGRGARVERSRRQQWSLPVWIEPR